MEATNPERLQDDEIGVTLPLDLPVDDLVARAVAALAPQDTASPTTAVPSTVIGKET